MDTDSHSMPWLMLSPKSQPVISPVIIEASYRSNQWSRSRQSGGKTFTNVLMSMFYNTVNAKQRNDKFHELFNTIPLHESLIAQFDCVLYRGDSLNIVEGSQSHQFNNVENSEIATTITETLAFGSKITNNEIKSNTICLYVGTLYISKDHLCFNTRNHQRGWLCTRLQISFHQIVNIVLCESSVLCSTNIRNSIKSSDHDDKNEVKSLEKFGNSNDENNGKFIIIETHLGKIQLNGFDSVDHVFRLIFTLWTNVKQNTDSNIIMMMPSLYNLIIESSRVHDDVEIMANDVRIEDLIHSIDIENENIVVEDETSEEEEEEEEEIKRPDEKAFVYKFKKNIPLKYKYNGPYFKENPNVKFTPPELNENEYILEEQEFKQLSPGMLFELIFSGHELSLQDKLLEAEGSTEVTPYGPYMDGHRHYSYIKKLNYSIGPKSTKCEVEQTIVRYDEECIEWVSTTKSLNVPNGNLFQVKTRFLFWWNQPDPEIGTSVGCHMRISYWIEWSGRSWLKSVIEKSCKQGIKESFERFDNFLKEYMERYLTLDTITVKVSNNSKEHITMDSKIENETAITSVKSSKIEQPNITSNDDKKVLIQVGHIRFFDVFLTILLTINLVVMLIILKSVKNNNNGKSGDEYDDNSNNKLVEMLIHGI